MLDRYCIYVKIYGERNTGTNFVQKIVHANYAVHCLQSNNHIYDYVKVLGRDLPDNERGEFRSAVVDIDCERTIRSDFGWKHGMPPRAEIVSAPHAANTFFICVAKHPLAWLYSLVDRQYNPIEKAPKGFSEFIRHDWRLARRDNVEGIDRINVVELWNRKNAAFRDLRSLTGRHVMVPYESILMEPHRFLKQLGTHLVAKRKRLIWAVQSTKGDGTTFEEYRDKYRMDGAGNATAPEDLAFIKGRIDPELMAELGYSWPAAET